MNIHLPAILCSPGVQGFDPLPYMENGPFIDHEHYLIGLEPWNFMTFHSVGNGITIPTDFHSIIFQRARRKTTNQNIIIIIIITVMALNSYKWVYNDI